MSYPKFDFFVNFFDVAVGTFVAHGGQRGDSTGGRSFRNPEVTGVLASHQSTNKGKLNQFLFQAYVFKEQSYYYVVKSGFFLTSLGQRKEASASQTLSFFLEF